MEIKKVIQYADGIMCRGDNKRVTVFARKDDKKKKINVLLQAVLPQDELSFNGNKIIRGKLKQTCFSLSKEAATLLYLSLQNMLHRTLEDKGYWLNSDKNPERSDTTKADSSNSPDNQNPLPTEGKGE